MPVRGVRTLASGAVAATLGGLALSLLLALHVQRVTPVYSAQVNVLLLLPVSSSVPNTLATSSESVVDTAGVLQRMVSGQGSGAEPVSDAVTLMAQGVRHGFSVRLPNSGGQWADLFSDPFLDVQAVGSSEAEVQREIRVVLAALEQDLHQIQDQQDVSPENRIGMQLNPSAPVVRSASGSRLRAGGAALLLGMATSITLVMLVGHLRARSAGDRQTPAPQWIPSRPESDRAYLTGRRAAPPRVAPGSAARRRRRRAEPSSHRPVVVPIVALLGLAVLATVLVTRVLPGGQDDQLAPRTGLGSPPPAGPTASARAEQVLQQPKRLPALLAGATASLRAVWLGDAVTTGQGASGAGKGYRALMSSRLRGDGPLQEVPGDSDGTLAGVKRIPSGLALAVVELGTAESEHSTVLEFATAYAAALDVVRSSSPHAVLVCAGVWRPSAVAGPYDQVVRSSCTAAGGTFVPLSDIYDRSDTHTGSTTTRGNTAPTSGVALPDDTGHAAIAARMLDLLGV